VTMGIMIIPSNNDPTNVFDRHYSLICPHCGVHSSLSAIAIPRYEYLLRFRPNVVGIVYCCGNCKEPVFLRFRVANYEPGNSKIVISDDYAEVERPQETFELNYLPKTVAEDFGEALTCFSNAYYNAFAAMCRRCIQSAFTILGATGKDRVKQQLNDVKQVSNLDDETFQILEQIIISGHDGAHPNLPGLSPNRAAILLEMMKDVLYQLFVRQAKLQEAIELRNEAIAESKDVAPQ